MAILIKDQIAGFFIPEAYVKITGFSCSKKEDGLFEVHVEATEYKDSTKDYVMGNIPFTFVGLTEAELTMPVFYSKILEMSKYADAVSV